MSELFEQVGQDQEKVHVSWIGESDPLEIIRKVEKELTAR